MADTVTRCAYDTGSMYGCEPACSERATVQLTYGGYGRDYTMPLCRRHVGPMRARVFPYNVEETLLTD